MLNVVQDTVIGNVRFNGIIDFNGEDSVDNIGNTGSITVPKQLNLDGKAITDVFKRGDITKVSLGYGDNLEPAFEGVVSSINIDHPIRFDLSGYEWFLSQVNFSKIFPQGSSSKEIVTYVINEVNKVYGLDFTVNITANSIDLPEQRYSNVSGLQIVSDLRKKYSIYSYFRGSVLYSGLKYPEFSDRKTFDFYLDGENGNTTANSLTYEVSDDIRVLVKATSYITKDNELSTITVTIGDKGGKEIPYQGYNLTKEQLTAKAKDQIEEYKKDGYKGTFTTIGLPRVNHGDVVNLISTEYPERDGLYLVKSVNISGTTDNGLSQVIELDLKV